MQDISVVKELRSPGAPLFLFECVLPSGVEFYWSTHAPVVEGRAYEPRVLSHSPIEFRCGGGDGSPYVPTVQISLANADDALSAITASQQWKGARLKIRFVVYDLAQDTQASNATEILVGVVSSADDSDHKTIRLSVANRVGTVRAQIPSRRIQRRCCWLFPRTLEERQQALEGAGSGRYSPFHGCGYSADVVGGVGNLNNGQPFVDCQYTKDSCAERGMFAVDELGRETRRFSGFEFVPLSRIVRGYGEQRRESIPIASPEDSSGTTVPIIYGKAWTEGIIVLAQSDGNMLRAEAVLCEGPIAGVIKVVANGVELPAGRAGADLTGTGWYNVISLGARNGAFNEEFFGSEPTGAGDPIAGLARISLALPEADGGGTRIHKVQILVEGTVLPIYHPNGEFAGDSFTSNPAWVLLDLLRRSGYGTAVLNIASFAASAANCSATMTSVDRMGRVYDELLADCNLLLRSSAPVGEILSAVQNGSGLLLRTGRDGRVECICESPIAIQQPEKPSGSNSPEPINGGWPAYEFCNGAAGFGGIALLANREPSLRMYSKPHNEATNRISVDFVDPHNDYVSDTFTLTDIDDVIQVGQEVRSRLVTAGVTGEAQAHRLCRRILDRRLRGNLFAEFQSSIKAILLRPGDLITISLPAAGLERQLFRVLSVAPGLNGERVSIVAQLHDDSWYETAGMIMVNPLTAQNAMEDGEPRPLLGDEADGADGFRHSVGEEFVELADGTQVARMSIGFTEPKTDNVSLHSRPTLGRAAAVVSGAGNWTGPQTLYYAVSTVDGVGVESVVSSTSQAVIPLGVTGAAVLLTGIRAGSNAVSMNVYRGTDPWQLRQVALEAPLSDQFSDAGLPVSLVGPPDLNFYKAVAEWRAEYLPPMAVIAGEQSAISVAAGFLTAGALAGKLARLHTGKGAGQERLISDNTESTISLKGAWHVIPDDSSTVCVVESGWNAGGNSRTSPSSIIVPSHEGSAVHIRVYGVNGRGAQSRKDLAMVTRHVVGSGGGALLDTAVAPAPSFGLTAREGGYLVVGGIGFPTLENTNSISAGVLQIFYVNEISDGVMGELAAPIGSEDEVLTWTVPTSVAAGTAILVDGEIVRCIQSTVAQNTCQIERGILAGSGEAHAAGTAVIALDQLTHTFAIPRGFFGSVGSGDFEPAVPLSNSRVAAATLSFLNRKGLSEAGIVNMTQLSGHGLRVLQGGQIMLQVSGFLTIQTSAVPPVVVEQARGIREVFAVVDEAPAGVPLVVRVRRNSEALCQLTIAPQSNVSNIVEGLSLPPLSAMDRISLDIVSLGVGEGTFPGRNLTISVRL